MKMKSLYGDYIQKSGIFVYPILGIKRGVSVTPIKTYLSWENKYSIEDNKLICTYYIRKDKDFQIFETVKLTNNPFFHEVIQLHDNIGAYVFDFSEMAEDFSHIVKGEYSKLSSQYKRKVLDFFNKQSSHQIYIESYLNPTKYIPLYSDILAFKQDRPEMIKLLTDVGELCSPPDLLLETLEIEDKVMNFSKNSLDLSE